MHFHIVIMSSASFQNLFILCISTFNSLFLFTLARITFQDVHETAAGALWNLAFNPGNALRIVEEGGVPALVQLCSSSESKMARFMSALALAYMFDGRYAINNHLSLDLQILCGFSNFASKCFSHTEWMQLRRWEHLQRALPKPETWMAQEKWH